MNSDKWERTEDIYGHRAKFHVGCRFCDDYKMVVRHSGIFDEKFMPVFGEGNGVNIMTYKCPSCANVIRFYVPDDMVYLSRIKNEIRGGTWFVPSETEWSDEDMEVGRQLVALGYFGGR